MKAEIGDYIKFYGITSQVIGISDNLDSTENYNTVSGHSINETELTIDDVLLASEVEIG